MGGRKRHERIHQGRRLFGPVGLVASILALAGAQVGYGSLAASPATSLAVAYRSAPPALPARAAASGAQARCGDVWFVGIAGSGEQRDGGSGYGPTIGALEASLRAELRGVTVTSNFVQYDPEKAGLAELSDVLARGDNSAFLQGEQRGVRRLKNMMQSRSTDCPDEVMIVAGYSQGAMVAVDALAELRNKDPRISRQVGLVELVASPYAHPTDASVLIGSAPPNHHGIYTAVGRPGHLGSAWHGIVFEACKAKDIVCDWRGRPSLKHYNDYVAIHGSYKSGPDRKPIAGKVLKRLAELGGVQIRKIPRNREISLTLQPGEPVDRDVLPNGGEAGHLVWSPTYLSGEEVLPTGITFDDGRLTGTPTQAGHWDITLSVHHRRLAPGASATVRLSIDVSNDSPDDSWTSIDPGLTVCGVRSGQSGWCWGQDEYGQTGASPSWPASPTALRGAWLSIQTTNFTTCGVRTDRTAICWGDDGAGQRGDGSAPPGTALPGRWMSVEPFETMTCGIRMDGSGGCWGANTYGQLGDGSTHKRDEPARLPGQWTMFTSNSWSTCGVQVDQSGWCWGKNDHGQVGNGTIGNQLSPVKLPGNWSQLSVLDGRPGVGVDETIVCGIQPDRSGWCWGANDWGQVGDGTTTERHVPTKLPGEWLSIAGDNGSTCGIQVNHTAWCWGRNSDGQAGISSEEESITTPHQVAGSWQSIEHADYSVCGVQTDDSGWCWGSNSDGQLGIGDDMYRFDHPTRVLGEWASIIPRWTTTCGIKLDGSGWCWGDNTYGQVGDGTHEDRFEPTRLP